MHFKTKLLFFKYISVNTRCVNVFYSILYKTICTGRWWSAPISRFGPGGEKIVLDPASKFPVCNHYFSFHNTYDNAAITFSELYRRLTVVRVGKQPCVRYGFPGSVLPHVLDHGGVRTTKIRIEAPFFSMGPVVGIGGGGVTIGRSCARVFHGKAPTNTRHGRPGVTTTYQLSRGTRADINFVYC